jgi:hypothetical protein
MATVAGPIGSEISSMLDGVRYHCVSKERYGRVDNGLNIRRYNSDAVSKGSTNIISITFTAVPWEIKTPLTTI